MTYFHGRFPVLGLDVKTRSMIESLHVENRKHDLGQESRKRIEHCDNSEDCKLSKQRGKIEQQHLFAGSFNIIQSQLWHIHSDQGHFRGADRNSHLATK